MSHCCSVCSIRGNHKRYYSKFIGSINDEASYFCDDCYDKEKENEEMIIKFAIKNGENISSLVKQEYLIDFINPTSNSAIIKPMNIHKIVSEVIDGVKRDFVMIDMEEYNNYMLLVACSNKKLIDDEKIKEKREKQQRQEAVERRKIEAINEKEKRDIEIENKAKEKIEIEIKINRRNNEKIKKEKEELKEQYKEVFRANPETIIKKCSFCKTLKIYPYHFKDENNKPFLKAYTKDKQQERAICCIDCFEEVQMKKEEKKLNNTHHCNICDKSFVAYTNELFVSHLKTTQHKRNEAKLKGKIDLSLLNVKELNKICSKTVDENGLYRINNYTKIKKIELLEKMNAIYDLLIFT
jgi:hypothetical protein